MKMLFVKSLISAILWILSGLAAEPTLEDNRLPLDEEYDTLWHKVGQPEMQPVRGDDQSFNAFYSGGGNDHFVSPIFPEIDARGFHATAFDNFENVYPAPRRYGLTKNKPFLKDQYYATMKELWTPPKFKEKFLNELLKKTPLLSRNEKKSGKSSHKTSQLHDDITEPVKVSFVRIMNNSNGLLDDKVKYGENCCEKEELESSLGSHSSDKKNSKRAPDMNSRGFHGDTFSRGFGHFDTMDKRAPDMTAMGFHGDTFNRGFGHFDTMDKRGYILPGLNRDLFSKDSEEYDNLYKKSPHMNSRGFHADTFSRGFGQFDTMDKRSIGKNKKKFFGEPLREDHFDKWHKKAPDMNSRGFHGDTFSRGFGQFDTMDKRAPDMTASGFHGDTFNRGFGHFDTMDKRAPDMNSRGFHGDTFSRGFGQFDTMDKRAPGMTASGFHGDTFNRGFGHFDTMDKRAPDMNSRGFHGDTFSRGFGNFDTMDKRAPDMNSKGFHGDTFSRGFGNFDTMDKRAPDMNSKGFHGDTFSRGFGNFDTMDKRAPDMTAMGFHGDTFNRGFGHFDTMDKRAPDMSSRGFHGDTFSRGFGNFDTMDKRNSELTIDYGLPILHEGFVGHGVGKINKRAVYPRSHSKRFFLIKRVPDMTSNDWHGDTFHTDFGGFNTMK